MRLCIVQPQRHALSETFIRAQVEKLPAETTVLYGKRPWADRTTLHDRLAYVTERLQRVLRGGSKSDEYTRHCLRLLQRLRPDVVIAQYGTVGVQIMDACRILKLPWIVHFRGFDASTHALLDRHRERYRLLLHQADAIIAVSRSIQRTLLELGAPSAKLHYNPSGADCSSFTAGNPAAAPPVFLSVGRMVDKKAPQLTILAFAEVHRLRKQTRLRMIGEGPLLPFCKELVRRLDIEHAVHFLGGQPHDAVRTEMAAARALVQHCVVARSGDSEGTPVSVMEAGACGLPVVATRHAGIPDVVLDGETGFLVEERDVAGMAGCMLRLVDAPQLAAQLGGRARERVEQCFSQQQSLRRLWGIIEQIVAERGRPHAQRAA